MISALVIIHTIISLAAVILGVPVVMGLVGRTAGQHWTGWFLLTAVAATATGFLFPFTGITPAFTVGIVSTVVLAATLFARYLFALSGGWRAVWIVGLVASEFFLVFVTVAQAFAKVPGLMVLAPGGVGPVFAVAEVVALGVFVTVGFVALRRAGRMPA